MSDTPHRPTFSPTPDTPTPPPSRDGGGAAAPPIASTYEGGASGNPTWPALLAPAPVLGVEADVAVLLEEGDGDGVAFERDALEVDVPRPRPRYHCRMFPRAPRGENGGCWYWWWVFE